MRRKIPVQDSVKSQKTTTIQDELIESEPEEEIQAQGSFRR
jgi:hypothetical protein